MKKKIKRPTKVPYVKPNATPEPTLTIHHRDGTKTVVTPLKMWTP